MSTLKETLRQKIEEHRPRTTRLLKEYSDVKSARSRSVRQSVELAESGAW